MESFYPTVLFFSLIFKFRNNTEGIFITLLNLASEISTKNYYLSNETSILKQFKSIFYKATVQRDRC